MGDEVCMGMRGCAWDLRGCAVGVSVWWGLHGLGGCVGVWVRGRCKGWTHVHVSRGLRESGWRGSGSTSVRCPASRQEHQAGWVRIAVSQGHCAPMATSSNDLAQGPQLQLLFALLLRTPGRNKKKGTQHPGQEIVFWLFPLSPRSMAFTKITCSKDLFRRKSY